MPVIPNPPIFQPIIEQNLCTNGVCEVKSLCREYQYIDGKYKHVANHALKACHGTFGYTADGRLAITNALLSLKDWIATNCRLPKKEQNDFTKNFLKQVEAIRGPSGN